MFGIGPRKENRSVACRTIKLPSGDYAIVCGLPKPKRCACGSEASKLCDFPVRRRTGRRSKTCDAPLCKRCADHVEPDKDFCKGKERYSMPDKPTWIARAPEILKELRVPGVALVGREGVERLFGLSPRAAQKLMALAGTLPTRGGRIMASTRGARTMACAPSNLISYIEAKAAPELKEAATQAERDRRRRLAQKLREPRVMVECDPRTEEVMARQRLSDLPWLELLPGEIRIKGSTPEELLVHCLSFAKTLGQANLEEFREKVKI